MHEWSFARTLLQQAALICREQGALRPVEVCVQLGPLSGVEASLLESAFDQLVREQGIAPLRLVVETTMLVVRCRDCRSESEIPDFDFYCRVCHSRVVQVVRGDQLQLVSVTVDNHAASPVRLSRAERAGRQENSVL